MSNMSLVEEGMFIQLYNILMYLPKALTLSYVIERRKVRRTQIV